MKHENRNSSQNNYKQVISDWIKTHPTHAKVLVVAVLVVLFCIIFATCKNDGEEQLPAQQNPAQTQPPAATASATSSATTTAVAPSVPEVTPIPAGPDGSGEDTVVEENAASYNISLPGNKSMVMLKIKNGSFQMGSPVRESGRNKSERLKTVTIADDFYMGAYEVTQEQYQAVMKQNPSHFKGATLPVENVTWGNAVMFCDRLNRGKFAPEGWEFSLPSSAQWEYACRAGTNTPFFWGGTLNGDKANCYGTQPYGTRQKGKYVKRTTPVGSYGANAWGLYDMHGNVWEWCMDRTTNGARILRGGSWATGGVLCRSAARLSNKPAAANRTVGFRVVLVKK